MMTESRGVRRRRAVGAAISAAFIGWSNAVPAAVHTQSSAPRDDVWVPIEMPDRRRMIATAEINGRRARILLDTGAGPTVVNRAFADAINLQTKTDFAAADMTGVAAGRSGATIKLALGDAHYVTQRGAVMDLSPLNAGLLQPIDAIVGRDLFQRFRLEIDFQNSRLRVLPGAAQLPGAVDIDLRRQSAGLPTITLAVEGRMPIEAMFDMGADCALYLSPDYIRAQNLLENRPASTVLSAGVAGREESAIATLAHVNIGPCRFESVPVEAPRKWTFDVPAIVGFPIIRRFGHAVFDFASCRLQIAARGWSRDAFRKDRSGLNVMPTDDGLTVVHIAPESPAARAGLQLGDQIVAINGEACTRAYLARHGRIGAQPPGTVLKLALKNGSKNTLELRDYF